MLRAILCAFLLLPPPTAAQDPGDWCAPLSCTEPDEDDLDDQWDSSMQINPFAEFMFCEEIYWQAMEFWSLGEMWTALLPDTIAGGFFEDQDPPILLDYAPYLWSWEHDRPRVIAHEACESLGLGDYLCEILDHECLHHGGGHLAQLPPPTLPRIDRSSRVPQQVVQAIQVSETDTMTVVTLALKAVTSGWEEDQVVIKTRNRVDHLLRRTEDLMRASKSDCESATACLQEGNVWLELAQVDFKPDSAIVHVSKIARGTSNKSVWEFIKITLTPSERPEGWIIQDIHVLGGGH